ncbi:HNH endonuclease [Candidatus Poribacteria bacterium]|nr:HNH endonuclease [Candidatus Poribacteria bacterium]
MSSDLPVGLRQLVEQRANNCCEYCLLPQSVSLHKHEPDHIVPRQHGGKTEASNLALSCMRCNRYKGPNVGSFDPQTGELVPFFNPRTQNWAEHFELRGGIIRPLTAEARVTVEILRLNDEERIAERQSLIEIGLYRVVVRLN